MGSTEFIAPIIQASKVKLKLQNSLNLLLWPLMFSGTTELIALFIQASNF